MRNKLFLPLSPLMLYVYYPIIGIMFGLSLYALVLGIVNPSVSETIEFDVVEGTILSVCAVLLMGYYLLKTWNMYVCFKKEYVYVPMGWGFKAYRIQFKTKVYYKDIKSIEIITSNRNSKNRLIEYLGRVSMAKNHYYYPYIEILKYNGNKERILIYHQSKRQWVKMLDEFKQRCELCENVIEMQDSKEMVANIKNIGWDFSWKKKKPKTKN